MQSTSLSDRIGLAAALLFLVGAAIVFDHIYRGPAVPAGEPPSPRSLLVVEHGGRGPTSVRRTAPVPRRESRREVPRPAPPPAPATRTHVVRSGESLYAIAVDVYGTGERWREIAEANGLDRPELIQPGQELLIP